MNETLKMNLLQVVVRFSTYHKILITYSIHLDFNDTMKDNIKILYKQIVRFSMELSSNPEKSHFFF